MRIELPWPDKRLSPNARLHWRAKVGPKQAAKIKAGWLTVAAKGFHEVQAALAANDNPIPVAIRFYPPDRRHRDDDNMIGAFKAARDGIADALGVNDRRFRPHYFFEEAEKPGKVVVIFGDSACQPTENAPGVAQEGEPQRCLRHRAALTETNVGGSHG